jgi:hypothetical protein
LEGRFIFDSTASVIVATMLPAKLSTRAIARSTRIAAAITKIVVALINASSKSLGSLHNLAEIPVRTVSGKNASYLASGRKRAIATVF